MVADVTRRVGDTGPPIPDTLYGPDGSAENLTGATVVLNRRRQTSTNVAQGGGTVSITDANNGAVSYAMDVADNAVPGIYEFWFTATLSGGEVRSYGSFTWQVLP